MYQVCERHTCDTSRPLSHSLSPARSSLRLTKVFKEDINEINPAVVSHYDTIYPTLRFSHQQKEKAKKKRGGEGERRERMRPQVEHLPG